MRYHFLIETTECISNDLRAGIKFYVEKRKGFEVFKKTKKGKKYIGYCSDFGSLVEMADNVLPHRNQIYLNP